MNGPSGSEPVTYRAERERPGDRSERKRAGRAKQERGRDRAERDMPCACCWIMIEAGSAGDIYTYIHTYIQIYMVSSI